MCPVCPLLDASNGQGVSSQFRARCIPRHSPRSSEDWKTIFEYMKDESNARI